MTEKPAVYEVSQKVEQVVLAGDLSQLGPSERVNYYKAVCDSLGLNPLTRPFEFLKLQGRLILYPRAALADQLRRLHQVSIDNIERITNKNLYTVIVRGHTADGRTDEASASVDISKLGNSLLANACMKCETKAKRRFTLSIIGLGWLESVSVDAIDEGRQLPAYSDADLAEVRDVTAEVLSEQDIEDITDGVPVQATVTEDASEPEVKSKPKQNGRIKRPAPPETVRSWLRTKAAKGSTGSANEKQIGLLAGKIGEALQNRDDKPRHLVYNWLWGTERSALLPRGAIQAMLDWLVMGKDEETGDYPLHPDATQELLAMYKQAQLDAGQQEMEV